MPVEARYKKGILMHRLFLALNTLVFGLASLAVAQTTSTLEFESDGATQSLEVNVVEARITDGVVQIDAAIINSGAGILLDLGTGPAIAVSSANATVASDLILISQNGTMITIIRNAAPGSRNAIELSSRTAVVLQMPAGAAHELNLSPGSSVSHEILGN